MATDRLNEGCSAYTHTCKHTKNTGKSLHTMSLWWIANNKAEVSLFGRIQFLCKLKKTNAKPPYDWQATGDIKKHTQRHVVNYTKCTRAAKFSFNRLQPTEVWLFQYAHIFHFLKSSEISSRLPQPPREHTFLILNQSQPVYQMAELFYHKPRW